MSTREQQIAALEKDWAENPRWKGVKRGYSAADVVRLRGSLPIDYTLRERGPFDFLRRFKRSHYEPHPDPNQEALV